MRSPLAVPSGLRCLKLEKGYPWNHPNRLVVAILEI